MSEKISLDSSALTYMIIARYLYIFFIGPNNI